MAAKESRAVADNWNVVATVEPRCRRRAQRLLAKWGVVLRTGFYNVLAMKVADPMRFLHDFAAAVEEAPGILNDLSHVMPMQVTFDFATAQAFESQARATATAWAPRLAGKSFHVRLHRRGLKGVIATPAEERLIAEALLTATGHTARIGFEDPDAVLQIETIDGRAGMSLWTSDDLRRYPFLGLD